MGFLDDRERTMDFVLTREGRRRHARGELRFAYFALFDDEVDYDPAVYGSGSMDELELERTRIALIESGPVLEAMVGLDWERVGDVDYDLGPRSRIFDMPQARTVLPTLEVSPDILSASMEVRQAISNVPENGVGPVGVIRSNASQLSLEFRLEDFFEAERGEGVLVRVFTSGSDGLVEMRPSLDYMGDYRYGNLLRVDVDDPGSLTYSKISKSEGEEEI
jgi:hypothetical protein